MDDSTKQLLLSMRSIAARVTIAIVSLIAFLFVVVNIARIGTFYWLYSDAFGWSTTHLGLDQPLATVAATVFTAVVTLTFPSLAWLFLWGKRRMYAIATISASICAVGLASHFAGADVNFDRRSGASLKYYAMTPEGVAYSFTSGFDPKYGVAYKPLTAAVVKSLEATKGKRDDAAEPSVTKSSGVHLPPYRVQFQNAFGDLATSAPSRPRMSVILKEFGYADDARTPYLRLDIESYTRCWSKGPFVLQYRKKADSPVLVRWSWTPRCERAAMGDGYYEETNTYLNGEQVMQEREPFEAGVLELVPADHPEQIYGRIAFDQSKHASL